VFIINSLRKKIDIDLDYPPSKSFQIIIIEKITITKIESQVSIDSFIDSDEQFKYLKFSSFLQKLAAQLPRSSNIN